METWCPSSSRNTSLLRIWVRIFTLRTFCNGCYFPFAGRVQVTTQTDREKEEGPNKWMYWAAERFITRTSQTHGKVTWILFSLVKMCFVNVYYPHRKRKKVGKSYKCSYCLTDSRSLGKSGSSWTDAEAFERFDSCHRATAPEDHRFAEW